MQTVYVSQYDSFTKTTRSVPQQRSVSQVRSENVCRYEPHLTNKTVYEFQMEQRFTPPSTEYLESRKLVMGTPLCYEVEAAASRRLVGTLWRRPAPTAKE